MVDAADPSGRRRVRRYSADAFLVESATEPAVDLLQSITLSLGSSTEAHCGENSVLVRFDPNQVEAGELANELATLTVDVSDLYSEHLTLRIRYDGPDLGEVAEATGMSVADVIELHSATTFHVAFAGFSPGFTYLTGLPEQLQLPRRANPRPSVPAGSLAIAAHYCAIYPSASPGGWHLLGTSNAELFNAHRNPPNLLRPGMTVRFEPAR